MSDLLKSGCEKHHGWERNNDEPCEWCEIERLRDDLQINKIELDLASTRNSKAVRSIEELEADVRFYRDGNVQDSTDPAMFRTRVKELEKERDAAEAELWGANYITNEMIDEAVDLIENLYSSDDQRHGLGIIEVAKSYMWQALNKLNIFRCKGCKGKGVVQWPAGPGVAIKIDDCPDCNGHGWVIGEEDE